MRCYLAGPLEFADLSHGESWKTLIKKALPYITFYDPSECESNKTGNIVQDSNKELVEYKKSGDWVSLCKRMNNIWWGDNSQHVKKHTLYLTDLHKDREKVSIERYLTSGDFEAVALSDLVIARLPKDVKIFGTAAEITLAYLLGIPTLILLPDSTPMEQNSTMCFFILSNNGNLFTSIKALTTYISEYFKEV